MTATLAFRLPAAARSGSGPLHAATTAIAAAGLTPYAIGRGPSLSVTGATVRTVAWAIAMLLRGHALTDLEVRGDGTSVAAVRARRFTHDRFWADAVATARRQGPSAPALSPLRSTWRVAAPAMGAAEARPLS